MRAYLGACEVSLFVIVIALFNVGLGFAIALWIGREVLPKDEMEIVSGLGPQDPREVMERNTPRPPTDVTKSSSLPAEWVSMLDEIATNNSFVSAAMDVFKIDIAGYRDQLVTLETAVRRHRHGMGDRPIGEIVEELKDVNASWLRNHSQALSNLHDATGSFGDLAAIKGEIEMVFEEQAAQVETSTGNLASIDLSADVSDGCRQLLGEIGKLLTMSHRIRDGIYETVTQVFASEARLEILEQRLLVDSLTGLYSRVGLEAVTWKWWCDDPTRQRQASIAMFDIDRFAEVNARYGPVTSDQILFAVGQLLRDAIRDDRGYDVATRYSGQRFVLFFGDTRPRNAVTAVERIRRIVEESTIMVGDTEIRLTVSAGLTPIAPSDTTGSLMARAARALAEAKHDGGNCTRVDEGQGPCEMAPPQINVNGRTVLLNV